MKAINFPKATWLVYVYEFFIDQELVARMNFYFPLSDNDIALIGGVIRKRENAYDSQLSVKQETQRTSSLI